MRGKVGMVGSGLRLDFEERERNKVLYSYFLRLRIQQISGNGFKPEHEILAN